MSLCPYPTRCIVLQTGGQAPPVGYGDGATPGVAPPQSADKALPDFFNQVEAIKVRRLEPSGAVPGHGFSAVQLLRLRLYNVRASRV